MVQIALASDFFDDKFVADLWDNMEKLTNFAAIVTKKVKRVL
jgi:hypothetical protein